MYYFFVNIDKITKKMKLNIIHFIFIPKDTYPQNYILIFNQMAVLLMVGCFSQIHSLYIYDLVSLGLVIYLWLSVSHLLIVS